MRTFIRFLFSFFGYNVYFIKRRQTGSAIELCSKEHEDKSWGNEKIAKLFEIKSTYRFYNCLCEFLHLHQLPVSGHAVCDVGCGSGILLSVLNDIFAPASLTGIDFSQEAVKLAKQKNPTGSFSTHDLYLPIEGPKFDCLLCTEVLEHLEHPQVALQTIFDALTPNGVAVLTVPNGRLDFFEGHINFWSLDSWRIFLEKNLPQAGISTGFLDQDYAHLYAIITKNS